MRTFHDSLHARVEFVAKKNGTTARDVIMGFKKRGERSEGIAKSILELKRMYGWMGLEWFIEVSNINERQILRAENFIRRFHI